MNKSERKKKYDFIVSYFTKTNPNPTTELNHKNNFELLVSVVLSAQCTDERVNLVTPALFERFPNPQEMAQATKEELFELIKSVTYPNSKANYLKKLSTILVQDFGGNIPNNREALESLPGVGRKSANVVLAVAFNQPTMPVDTHVFRVANRIGLVKKATTPLEVEKQLVANFPKETLANAHYWLILHGRYVCVARKPKCDARPLCDICDYYFKYIV